MPRPGKRLPASQIGRSNLTTIQVDAAREIEPLALRAHVADYPIVTARIVIHIDCSKLAIPQATLPHTAVDRVLAILYRITAYVDPVGIAKTSVRWINLSRSDISVLEVHRARELVHLAIARNGERPHYPIATAWIVVYPNVSKIHAGCSIALNRALAYIFAASIDCLGSGKAISATYASCATVWRALWKFTAPILGPVIKTTPHNVKSVPFGSSIRVFDADNGSTVSRIAYQVLPAAAVNPLEAEAGRVVGQDSVAFKPAPLRWLAGEIPNRSVLAVNTHLGHSIHHHFNSALAIVGIAAA
jgi:hypothetical protein